MRAGGAQMTKGFAEHWLADKTLLRWAAAEDMTETVIAAVSLLHERSVEEIAGKLTPAELADVTRLVSR